MRIRQMNNSERPREKMMVYGRESLSNVELLAVLLKNGTKKESVFTLANRLINHDQGGLRHLADMSIEELMDLEGIGIAKACEIHAAIELGIRISQTKIPDLGVISNAEDVVRIFMEEMRYYKKEVFNILLLDNKGRIISKEIVSMGDLSSSIVHPRETFRSAVKRSAASVILVHNHPSGNPDPSDEDIRATKRIVEAGNILGITVLDHLIIGDGTYVSLNAKGLM